MKTTKNITAHTETPLQSPETVQLVECTAEGEKATQGANKATICAVDELGSPIYNEATQKYFVDKFGTVENAKKCYNDYFDSLIDTMSEYENNRRKGGKYRKIRIEQLKIKVVEILKEQRAVTRNMRRYIEAHPETTPTDGETDAQTVNVSPEQGNTDRERENEPKHTYVDVEKSAAEMCENSKRLGTTSVMELPKGLEIRVNYILSVFGNDFYSYEEWRRGKCTFQVNKISVEGVAAGIAGWLNIKKPQTELAAAI